MAIRTIMNWIRRNRADADLEAILAHNAQIKREQAELASARARKALDEMLAEGGGDRDGEPPR